MSLATLILGESGTGKSTSLRNLNPADTLLIQTIKKPMPFRAKGWTTLGKGTSDGCIWHCDDSAKIVTAMSRSTRPVIVIDDFQYLLANEFMRRTEERGYDKFTEIGRHAWDVLSAASALPDSTRVYILSHTETSDAGRTKMKTLGRMLDEKITVEGMFSIVLRTRVVNDQYLFSTRNNGADTVKSPLGLFEQDLIDNDLSAVDHAICAYYDINQPA